MDSEFEGEFIGDALLAPRWIFEVHAANERADGLGEWRATAFAGFEAPEGSEGGVMPADEGLRLDNDECFAPVEEVG
jgi:hypothetical protein